MYACVCYQHNFKTYYIKKNLIWYCIFVPHAIWHFLEDWPRSLSKENIKVFENVTVYDGISFGVTYLGCTKYDE